MPARRLRRALAETVSDSPSPLGRGERVPEGRMRGATASSQEALRTRSRTFTASGSTFPSFTRRLLIAPVVRL